MAITDRATADEMFVGGKAYFTPFDSITSGSVTGASANNGHINFNIATNNLGTTLPSTLVGLRTSLSSDPVRFMNFIHSYMGSATVGGSSLCWLYLIGTQVLSTTGDQFTHNAATFPLTRTWLGQTTNIPLTPLIQVTTQTATTAPVIRLRTNAGGAGYTDQDGNSIVGAETFTFPSATTSTNTTLHLPLELSDTSVLDITAIETTTAGTAGAASVWGMEYISPMGVPAATWSSSHDAITGGLTMQNLQPATPTSGSLTSYLAIVRHASNGTRYGGFIVGVVDV